MMMRLVLGLLLVLPVQAAVYKWVDGQGNVHYGDTPPIEGAQPVDLPDYSRYAPRPLAAPPAAQGGDVPDAAVAASPSRYERLAIVSPAQNDTVRSAQGTVTVQLEIEPDLGEDHAILFVLDGQRVEPPAKGTSFTLNELDRGSHTLQASVIDAAQRVLLSSDTVIFTLRRPSLLESAKAPPDNGTDDNGTDTQRPFDPDFQAPTPTPGRTNPDLTGDYRPSGTGISTTPGRTNPAFAPKYSP